MSTNVVVLQLVLLGVILESDLGLRKIGWFRVARPIIAVCALAPIYLTSLPTSGHNVTLAGLAVLVGAMLGLVSVSPLVVSVGFVADYRGHWARLRARPGTPAIVSRAGGRYAAIWIGVCVLRLLFAYGSQHWFAHGLGRFLANNSLTADGLTDALIFFSVAMDVFRSAGLVVRRRGVRARVPEEALRSGAHPPSHPDGAAHAASSVAKAGVDVLGAAVSVVAERDERRAQRRRRRRRV